MDLLSALTWRDALDFGVLYVVIYTATRLLRGTRALPVLLAVAFLATLSWVARWLDLVAIATLLKYFLEYIIIILIVVFHSELRRILLRVGQRLLPHARQEAAENAVEDLVRASERLAKARVGALFVLEGEIDALAVSSDSGVEIDSALKAETLVALQVPHSVNTAHDGAVVIRDFRIVRAGVILPLSNRTLDPRFGTRHRGAIGISEESDALVVVLSEERGEIRVVEGGEVSEPLDGLGLEERITSWLRHPNADSQPEESIPASAAESGETSQSGTGVEKKSGGVIEKAEVVETQRMAPSEPTIIADYSASVSPTEATEIGARERN